MTAPPLNPPWSPNMDDAGIGLSPPTKAEDAIAETSPETSPARDEADASTPSPTTPPTLSIHSTPAKSRVETQIPIRMTLHPMPPGILKLHLPPHTISKPKLMTKPTPPKSPDTLELDVMLVCSSAMTTDENLERAKARARQLTAVERQETRQAMSADGAASDEDEVKPLEGGEVNICSRCMERERKRAARKKVKKADEEETWAKDEHMRVIVFNTSELKDWQPLSSNSTPSGSRTSSSSPPAPEGALEVDLPMRIACYCRHHNEKVGFRYVQPLQVISRNSRPSRVIFTLKDYKDEVVAQAVTSSVMITDDHKAHPMPTHLGAQQSIPEGGPFPTQMLGMQVCMGDMAPQEAAVLGPHRHHLAGGIVFSSAQSDLPGPHGSSVPFRLSHSSSDLQSLRQNYVSPFAPTSNAGTHMRHNSASATPRTLSRQASPSGATGPVSKKRKPSGSGRLPPGLTMTRLDTAAAQLGHDSVFIGTGPTSPAYPPPGHGSHLPPDDHFSTPSAAPRRAHYGTNPPTPTTAGFHTPGQRSEISDGISASQIYSAPSSAFQSRAPSPVGAFRAAHPPMYNKQAQMAQAVTNGLIGLPLAMDPQRPPRIHKLVPAEGPKSGGIEVTCLGSGFCQGLEVMFGDMPATTTTFWGDTALVCLLPPSVQPGPVIVSFKHEQLQQPPMTTRTASASLMHAAGNQAQLFRYLDDDEEQLLRMALIVLGNRMTGRMEDATEIARRIIRGDPYLLGNAPPPAPYNGVMSVVPGIGDAVQYNGLPAIGAIDLNAAQIMDGSI